MKLLPMIKQLKDIYGIYRCSVLAFLAHVLLEIYSEIDTLKNFWKHMLDPDNIWELEAYSQHFWVKDIQSYNTLSF
jgi:hypothetical protein